MVIHLSVVGYQLDDEPILYVVVSKNSVTTKWMVYNGKPY